MNRILTDYLRRWWGLILLGGLAVTATAVSGDPKTMRMGLIWALFAGPLLLAMEHRRGYLRILATLPVDLSKTARAMWGISIVTPTLLTLAGELLGSVIAVGFGNRADVPWEVILINALFVVLWLGSSFCIMTFLPWLGAPNETVPTTVRGVVAGGLWGFWWGGYMIFAMKIAMRLDEITTFSWWTVGALLLVSVWGFSRAKTLFPGWNLPSSPVHRPSPVKTSPPAPSKPSTSGTGWLCSDFGASQTGMVVSLVSTLRQGLMITMMMLMIPVIFSFLQRPWEPIGIMGVLSFGGFGITMGWITSLRQWRMLPISTDRLMFIGLAQVWIPTLLSTLATLVLSAFTAHSISTVGSLLFFFGVLTQSVVAIGMNVRNPMARIMVMMVPFYMMMGLGRFGLSHLSQSAILPYALLLLFFGSAALIRHTLKTSSQLYHPVMPGIPTPER